MFNSKIGSRLQEALFFFYENLGFPVYLGPKSISPCKLCTVIVYETHFKDHLEILTVKSRFQHRRCKILFFPYKFFLKK